MYFKVGADRVIYLGRAGGLIKLGLLKGGINSKHRLLRAVSRYAPCKLFDDFMFRVRSSLNEF
jgi:hypothetical protein